MFFTKNLIALFITILYLWPAYTNAQLQCFEGFEFISSVEIQNFPYQYRPITATVCSSGFNSCLRADISGVYRGIEGDKLYMC